MTAPDLKPCPFCGGGDVITAVDHEQGSKWGYAGCDACGARCPEVRTGYDTAYDALWRAEAISAWNTRTTPLADALAVPEIAALVEAFKSLLADAEEIMNVPAECYAALRAIGEGRNG